MSKLLESLRRALPEPLVDWVRTRVLNRRFRPYVKNLTVDGQGIDFLIGDPTGEAWYAGYGNALSPELAFTKALVRPGDTILEVGAHHGMFTILLAHWTGPSGRVVALEALPRNAEILRRNLELNRIANVTVLNQAAGASDGMAAMRGGSNSSVSRGWWGAACMVEMARLDRHLALKPRLVKIDVEGYEIEVLKGATELLKTRPHLAIEVHGAELARHGLGLEDLLGFIDRDAYAIWLQPDGASPPQPYAGGPVAPRPQIHLYALGA